MKLSETAAEVETGAAFWPPAAATSLGDQTPSQAQQTTQLMLCGTPLKHKHCAVLTVCWNFQKVWLTLYLWSWHKANAMLWIL